jgi:aspartate/methionine/tyrosine aminotransferase
MQPGQVHVPVMQYHQHLDRLLLLGTFSKSYAMTGWRLGWLVVPPDSVAVFEKLAQNLFICASTLSQHAALACFETESMAICEQRRDTLRSRRDALIPALENLGFGVPVRPDGAFYVWLDCSRFGDSSALAVPFVPSHHDPDLIFSGPTPCSTSPNCAATCQAWCCSRANSRRRG